MPLSRRGAGFSLLEAVIASALLLTTCVSVSTLLAAALRAEGRLRERDVLLIAIESELTRLEALAFAPGVLPLAGAPLPAGELARGSLVGEAFPHADASRNGPMAYYCPDAGWGEPGTFVTTVTLPWGELRRVVRFVTRREDAWETLEPGALRGWSVWASRQPPATAVRIDLTATTSQSSRPPVTRSVVFQALEPSVEPAP